MRNINSLLVAGLVASATLLLSTPVALSEDIAAGKGLYVDNCLRCHGNKGQGGIGVKLAGDAANWSIAPFKKAVLEGYDDGGKKLKAVMPRWGRTGWTKPKGVRPTDADLANILAYLKTFGP